MGWTQLNRQNIKYFTSASDIGRAFAGWIYDSRKNPETLNYNLLFGKSFGGIQNKENREDLNYGSIWKAAFFENCFVANEP